MARRKGRNRHDWGNGGWPAYVSVAEHRREAEQKVKTLTKNGKNISPVTINGRMIATTFWGKAWCKNLESYMDYANRLPRGRSYVRNGSVIDLQILAGRVTALVNGSSLYKVEVNVKPVDAIRWQSVIRSCSGKIDSLVELLQGSLSQSVMQTVTNRDSGLFPDPMQITLSCSCPDLATMCKHVAATLYGVGNRLDQAPDLLFKLRQVDYLDLITSAANPENLPTSAKKGVGLAAEDLGAMFGIEIEADHNVEIPTKKSRASKAKVIAGKTAQTTKKKVITRTPSNKPVSERAKPAVKATSAKKKVKGRPSKKKSRR